MCESRHRAWARIFGSGDGTPNRQWALWRGRWSIPFNQRKQCLVSMQRGAFGRFGDDVYVAFGHVICELESGNWARTSTMTASTPKGGSVFLVEDEVMIRMMVADMLDELGYSIAAEAGEINEAIRLAQSTDFDIAILDVNVNGKVISPVASVIEARNRPFIFATGYGAQGLPEEYRNRPALQKPFQMETLAKMITSTLKGATV
jgi:CheY-like chemotaxis protein